jgi:hypothetical protein
MPLQHKIVAAVGASVIALGSAVLSAPVASAQAKRPAPMSWYGFGRVTPTGLVRDSSHQHRPLQLIGHWSRVPGVQGKTDGVRFLAKSLGSIANSDALIPRGRPFAVAMVVRLRNFVGSDSPNLAQLGFYSDAGQWKVEAHPSSGRVSCRLKGTRGTVQIYSKRSIDDGQFHSIVCFRLHGRVGIKVDGTRGRSRLEHIGRINSNRTVHIGNKSMRNDTDQFRGVFDYFSVAVGPRPIKRALAHAPTLP